MYCSALFLCNSQVVAAELDTVKAGNLPQVTQTYEEWQAAHPVVKDVDLTMLGTPDDGTYPNRPVVGIALADLPLISVTREALMMAPTSSPDCGAARLRGGLKRSGYRR